MNTCEQDDALEWLRTVAATNWKDYDAAEAGTALRQHATHLLERLGVRACEGPCCEALYEPAPATKCAGCKSRSEATCPRCKT